MIKAMLHPTLAEAIKERRDHIDSNVAGFVGWDRLQDALRHYGEVKIDEKIEAIVITNDGIQLFVKRR